MADLSMCMVTAPTMVATKFLPSSFVFGATAAAVSKEPWYFTAFWAMSLFVWQTLSTYHFEDDFASRHDYLLYHTLCFAVGLVGAMFLQTLGNFPRLFNTRAMKTRFETFGEIFDKRYFSPDPIVYFVAGQMVLVGTYLVLGRFSDPDCLVVPKTTADVLGWILIVVGAGAVIITFIWSFFGGENYKIEMRRRFKYLLFLLAAMSLGPTTNDLLAASGSRYYGLAGAFVILAVWVLGFFYAYYLNFYNTDTDVMKDGVEVPTQYENALRKTYGAGYMANLAANPAAATATRRQFDHDGFVTWQRALAFFLFQGGYIFVGFLSQWLVAEFWISTQFAIFITLSIVTVVYVVILIILTYMMNVTILRTGSRRTNGASKYVSNNGNGTEETSLVTPQYNIGKEHPLGATNFNVNTFMRT